MTPTLHIFPYSNYCEKALWTLDALGVRYRVQYHYPGPHGRRIKALSGQTAVPVLEHDGKVTAGSNHIIEAFAGTPAHDALIPAEHRAEIMAWQQKLDDIGGILRGALFHSVLGNRTLAIRLLTCDHKNPWGGYGLFFRAFTPLLRSMLEQKLPNLDSALKPSLNVLSEVTETARDGYLVGGRFTLADLTAAAIFFPICNPPGALGHDVATVLPELGPWRTLWAGNPGADYVARIYRDHRRAQPLQIAA